MGEMKTSVNAAIAILVGLTVFMVEVALGFFR